MIVRNDAVEEVVDVAWHTGLDDVQAEEVVLPAAAVDVCEKSIASCSFPQ